MPEQTITLTLPLYGLDEDNPMTCPMCGGRTDFDELDDGLQRHTCLRPACRYEFLAE